MSKLGIKPCIKACLHRSVANITAGFQEFPFNAIHKGLHPGQAFNKRFLFNVILLFTIDRMSSARFSGNSIKKANTSEVK